MENNFGILSAESQLTAANRTIRARRSGHLPTIDGTIDLHPLRHRRRQLSRRQNGHHRVRSDHDAADLSGRLRQLPHAGSPGAVESISTAACRQSRTVSRDTRNLFRRVATDVVRVKARLQAITSLESSLEATETGYEVGTRNIVDVLQAQNRLFASQFDYADSRYNYILGAVSAESSRRAR